MAKLEYHLDNTQSNSMIYFYDNVEKDEIALRFSCDYFVKDGTVYEKTKAVKFEDDVYAIYVISANEEEAGIYDEPMTIWGGIKVEIRHFKEDTDEYPLVTIIEYNDDDYASLTLMSNEILIKDTIWEKTSTEVDEDRKTYVVYAQPLKKIL